MSNHLNMFDCNQCGKSYKWRDSLTRHKKMTHCPIKTKVEKYNNQGEEYFQHLTRSNAVLDSVSSSLQEVEITRELLGSDGIPVTPAIKRNLLKSVSDSF